MNLALQAAIFQALQSPLNSVLARLVGPDGTVYQQPAIYDHVPDLVQADDHYPYVVVGDDTGSPFDTDDTDGQESTITIHVWSRSLGRAETKKVQRAIYKALHKQLIPVADQDTVDCIWEYAETILEADGVTRHGVQRFRITTQEE